MAYFNHMSEFFHILITKNDHKYILCCYKIRSNDELFLIVTDGQYVYKTRCKHDLTILKSNSSEITIDLRDKKFFVRFPKNEEYVLAALQGKEKQEELFNLIAALAELKTEKTELSQNSSKKLSYISASLSIPVRKKLSEQTRKKKGNSILNPSGKKRKCAEGVIFEDE